MSDLEKLKKMDADEVHKKTFVLPKVFNALVKGQYEKLGNKTKALGFVTILERELELNLNDLKREIEEYFSIRPDIEEIFDKEESPKRSYGSLIGFVALLALLGGGGYLFYTQDLAHTTQTHKEAFSSSSSLVLSSSSEAHSNSIAISSSSSSSSVALAESNESIEKNETAQEVALDEKSDRNLTQPIDQERQKSEPVATLPTITLVPKAKLWVGIIYLDDYSKKNYITSKPIEINTSRDQLIVTGHGFLKFDIDGEERDYNSKNKLRFLYRAGELEELNKKSFRLYNRGKDW